jgi:limonene-1,2-epoxide hydrolase
VFLWEDAMTNAKQLVQEFCDLMGKRNADALRTFVADDVVYQNTGMPASVGAEATLANLAGQFSMFPDSYEYRVKNIVAEGDVVMTERQDMIKGPDGSLHPVPVMGTFVVRNGKIARWTDYWDTSLPGKMMAGEDYSALVPQY